MITIQRYSDWDIRMFEFFKHRRNIPYNPGKNDCALLCADHIMAITGIDLAREWRGMYGSEEEYNKILEAAGGLDALVTSVLGESVPRLLARRGDILLAKFKNNDSLGVCLGSTIAFLTKEGLDMTYSRRLAIKGWRVG